MLHWLPMVPAWAAQADYGVGYIGESRSNMELRSNHGSNEWINAAVVGISLAENTAGVVAQLTSQVEHRDYTQNTFTDETLFFLDAAGIWAIAPGRLAWSAADAFREATLDPLQAPTPANRTSTNVFEAGPDAYFRFGPTQTISLGARYGDVYVEDSDLDNSRVSAAARWMYRYSQQTTYSLNLERARVAFDNDVANESFRRHDLYLRLQAQPARWDMTLDVGQTRFEPGRSADVTRSLTRFTWRQELTSVSTAGVAASANYQELGSELLRYVTPPTSAYLAVPPAPALDVISNDIYYSRDFDMFYAHRGSRTNWTGRLVTRELDFESIAAADREEAGGYLDLAYLYSGVTTVFLSGSRLDIDYLGSGRRDEEKEAWLRIAYRLQRHLTVGLAVGRVQRASTDPTQAYVDDRAMLSVLWSTGQLYNPLSRVAVN